MGTWWIMVQDLLYLFLQVNVPLILIFPLFANLVVLLLLISKFHFSSDISKLLCLVGKLLLQQFELMIANLIVQFTSRLHFVLGSGKSLSLLWSLISSKFWVQLSLILICIAYSGQFLTRPSLFFRTALWHPYCIFHVTLPCHIFQSFVIKFSNCNYSLISWCISLKLELHTVLYIILMPDT